MIHDHALTLAMVITEDTFHGEPPEVFDYWFNHNYAACKAAFEKFCLTQERMEHRLNPLTER
jgi:hypothetical protein